MQHQTGDSDKDTESSFLLFFPPLAHVGAAQKSPGKFPLKSRCSSDEDTQDPNWQV